MRDNILMVVSGKKRIGKSNETLKKMIYQAYLSPHRRKVLYFDVNGEYGSYKIDGKEAHSIKKIGEHEIINYANATNVFEVRRIVPEITNDMLNNVDELEDYVDNLLITILVQFRNGILVLEDLNNVLGDVLPKRFTAMICNNPHRNCDIIIHFQSVGRLSPKLLQNTEYIRFHYQLDDLDDVKYKLRGDYEILKIAQNLVNNEFMIGNKRFHILLNREEKKISGKFSPLMLSNAIQKYLQQNPRKMKSILNEKNIKGKRVYNYESAMKTKTKELFEMYWGN